MRDFMMMDAAARAAFLRRRGMWEATMADISEQTKERYALHPLVHRTSQHGTPFVGACGACGKEGITYDMLTTDACSGWRKMTDEQATVDAVTGRRLKSEPEKV